MTAGVRKEQTSSEERALSEYMRNRTIPGAMLRRKLEKQLSFPSTYYQGGIVKTQERKNISSYSRLELSL